MGAVVVGIAVAIVVLLAGGGDDDEDGRVDSGLEFAEPVELSEQAKADLQLALEALPELVGETDAEQLHSVLGPPDVFHVWFDPADDGTAARSEVWYYLDLEVSYEFRDGVLLFTIPMDAVEGLLLIPLRFDPLAFSAETTVDELRAMLDDPAALTPEETPAEYELGVTVWAGDQIFAAFDANGELLYVETVALDLGDDG